MAGGILDHAVAVVGVHRVRRQHPQHLMTHILAKAEPPAGITDADYTDQLVAHARSRSIRRQCAIGWHDECHTDHYGTDDGGSDHYGIGDGGSDLAEPLCCCPCHSGQDTSPPAPGLRERLARALGARLVDYAERRATTRSQRLTPGQVTPGQVTGGQVKGGQVQD